MRRFPGLNLGATPTRRGFLKLFAGAAAVSCTKTDGVGSSGDRSVVANPTVYDYIVVGSGAGGGPLACSLALAGYAVLLIEAGDDPLTLPAPTPVNEQVPIFHPRASQDPAMRWDYVVQHYGDPGRQSLDDKSITDATGQPGVLYPRAAALGGCTTHHAMLAVYPHESDWDNIARLVGDVDGSGNVLQSSDWSSSNMRQYFTAIENCTYLPQGTPGHGFGGWLQTERASPTLGLTDAKLHQQILAASQAFAASEGNGLGTTVTELADLLKSDLNSADSQRDATEGLFLVPLATKGGVRNGPRELILQTAAQTPNLSVMTNTLATKVIFNDQRACSRQTQTHKGRSPASGPTCQTRPRGRVRRLSARSR
jgi:choline dehydrogenase